MSTLGVYRSVLVASATILFVLLWNPLKTMFYSSGKYHISYSLSTNVPDMFEVYLDTGAGWSEEQKVSYRVKQAVENEPIEFPAFEAEGIKHIRIDMGGKLKELSISNLSIRSSEGVMPIALDNPDHYPNCLSYKHHAGAITVTTTCEDSTLEIADNLRGLAPGVPTWKDRVVHGVLLVSLISLLVFFWKSEVLSSLFLWQQPQALLLASLFVGTLFAHLLFSFSGLVKIDSSLEKRALKEFPAVGEELNVKALEAWYEDHFVCRQLLTQARSKLSYTVFKKSALPNKVVLGANREMFPSSEFLLQDLQGSMRLEPLQLQSIHKNIRERISLMTRSGKDYYLILAPNKQTVYAQDLPAKYRATNAETMLTQLMNFLKQDSTIMRHVIDLREPLLQVAKDAPMRLYYNNDIHWNGYGAFFGYQYAMAHMANFHPAFKPYPLNAFAVSDSVDYKGDLAGMLLLHNEVTRVRHVFKHKQEDYLLKFVRTPLKMPVHRINTEHSSYPKVVVFRDSFWEELMPLMSHHFSEALYVWDPVFDVDLVKKEQPDVVIQEVAEMFIYDLLRVNPPSIHEAL